MELYLLLVVDDAEFLYRIVSLLKCVCLFIEISRLFSSLIMKYRTRKAIDSVVNLIFLGLVILLAFRLRREVHRVNVRYLSRIDNILDYQLQKTCS